MSNSTQESFDLQVFSSLLLFMESFSEIEKFEVRGQIQKVVINKLQAKQQIQVRPENQNTLLIQGNEQEQTTILFYL
jgi:hypothetical protein